jgi:hypothetical protein
MFLIWCFIFSLITFLCINEKFIDYSGITHINLPTSNNSKVNYNFYNFGSEGTVEGKIDIPNIPPPRDNHYRYWVWDEYYKDKDGLLHSLGHWNYYDTLDWDYDYIGEYGDANYNRYF